MHALISDFVSAIIETTWMEWLAVITGVLYVVSATFEKRIAWVFAGISTACYTYLCITSQLFIESVLQFFYFVMAIYGWISWETRTTDAVPIIQWPLKWHVWNIFISSVLALSLGFLAGLYTSQSTPYLDAFTTVFSLLATFMVAKKVLENWMYWIVIDAALILLYASRGFVLTGVQYAVFTVLALFAYLRWRKVYRQHA
jgi:nicotinamide mononucleotide transporter